VRAGLGAMALTFYAVLVMAGGNDVLADTFHWSLFATTWTFRVLLIIGPPIAFYVTRRVCLGLQHYDEELLHHGVETGIIRRLPSGEYIEVTAPLAEQRATVLAGQLGHEPLEHADAVATPGTGSSINRPVSPLTRAQRAIEGFFFERREPPRTDGDDDGGPRTLNRP
jgi:ubiquinol-cytochrome c reductase cytochrome b subunit